MGTFSFVQPNPHYLGRLLSAAEHKPILAGEDIYNQHGLKLWAAGKPISVTLRDRLLESRLHKPLEICIRLEDGVRSAHLCQDLERLLAQLPALPKLGGPHLGEVRAQFATLEVSGVPELQLSTVAFDGSGGYEHALLASLIATLLARRIGLPESELPALILAGLCHDFGEMYVNPDMLDRQKPLSVEQWRQVAVHPRIGALLLADCASMPPRIVRAVQEHHERLDGSGYPLGLQEDALSVHGRLLIVADVLAAIFAEEAQSEAQALLALRLVSRQFPADLVSVVCETLGHPVPPPATQQDPRELCRAAQDIYLRLQNCKDAAVQTHSNHDMPWSVRHFAGRVSELCTTLLVALNASGVMFLIADAETLGALDEEIAAELQLSLRELRWRSTMLLRHIWLEAGRQELGLMHFEAMLQCLLPVQDADADKF